MNFRGEWRQRRKREISIEPEFSQTSQNPGVTGKWRPVPGFITRSGTSIGKPGRPSEKPHRNTHIADQIVRLKPRRLEDTHAFVWPLGCFTGHLPAPLNVKCFRLFEEEFYVFETSRTSSTAAVDVRRRPGPGGNDVKNRNVSSISMVTSPSPFGRTKRNRITYTSGRRKTPWRCLSAPRKWSRRAESREIDRFALGLVAAKTTVVASQSVRTTRRH